MGRDRLGGFWAARLTRLKRAGPPASIDSTTLAAPRMWACPSRRRCIVPRDGSSFRASFTRDSPAEERAMRAGGGSTALSPSPCRPPRSSHDPPVLPLEKRPHPVETAGEILVAARGDDREGHDRLGGLPQPSGPTARPSPKGSRRSPPAGRAACPPATARTRRTVFHHQSAGGKSDGHPGTVTVRNACTKLSSEPDPQQSKHAHPPRTEPVLSLSTGRAPLTLMASEHCPRDALNK